MRGRGEIIYIPMVVCQIEILVILDLINSDWGGRLDVNANHVVSTIRICASSIAQNVMSDVLVVVVAEKIL